MNLLGVLVVVLRFLAERYFKGRWFIAGHGDKPFPIPPVFQACYTVAFYLVFPRLYWAGSTVQDAAQVVIYWGPIVVFLWLVLGSNSSHRYYIIAMLCVVALNVLGTFVVREVWHMYHSMAAYSLIWAILIKDALPPGDTPGQPADRGTYAFVLPVALAFSVVLSTHLSAAHNIVEHHNRAGREQQAFVEQLAANVSPEEVREVKKARGRPASVSLLAVGEAEKKVKSGDPTAFWIVAGYNKYTLRYGLCILCDYQKYSLSTGFRPPNASFMAADVALVWDGKRLGRRIAWPENTRKTISLSENAKTWLLLGVHTDEGRPAGIELHFRNGATSSLAAQPGFLTISYDWLPVEGQSQFFMRFRSAQGADWKSMIDLNGASISFIDSANRMITSRESELRLDTQRDGWNDVWFPRHGVQMTVPEETSRILFGAQLKPPVPKPGSTSGFLVLEDLNRIGYLPAAGSR